MLYLVFIIFYALGLSASALDSTSTATVFIPHTTDSSTLSSTSQATETSLAKASTSTCLDGDEKCWPTNTPLNKPCRGNTPQDRAAWCGTFDINTDYHKLVPDTRVVREYWLVIDELTAAPDGFKRPAMAINGSIPGPTIYADWGDTVIVHVTNKLNQTKNGTSIHWHGIRQNYTNPQDGVVSITQCPIPPGSSMTYCWRATQHGTSWYHSHIGLQAWAGVFGGIVINGPATANYDEDKGILLLTDWSHRTADELYHEAQVVGPPILDNALINGTNVFTDSGGKTTGSRFSMRVKEGMSYRLRVVNAALDTHFKFMIDGHSLTVIAMDLVPIKPYTTEVLSIGMGERYDIIFTANQGDLAKSFWMRAVPQEACSANANIADIKGIVHYGDDTTTPTSDPFTFVDNCDDELASSLVPHVPKKVSSPDWRNITDVTVARNSIRLFRWYLNSTTMEVLWESPTLLQISKGKGVQFPKSSAVISLPDVNEWVYLVINTTFPVSHPIHLHGHDFFILAQGTNPWNGSVAMENPPRRDTAMLAGNGYLVIAFETDNPGAWLMHCHIGWHTTEGFALQFIEREREIGKLIQRDDSLRKNCDVWTKYDKANNITQEDSGV